MEAALLPLCHLSDASTVVILLFTISYLVGVVELYSMVGQAVKLTVD